ncbi:MAG: hypothetical protein EOP84_31470, partial [Verrucomicrobiaceae bacterium]
MSSPDHSPLPALYPLAGLCSFEQAQRPGLSVDECVRRLKRYHYAFKRLHEIFIARLTAEPLYELKMAFSLHGYYCAEHAAVLRTRVGEMREPPLGLEIVPDESLAVFFDEILSTPTTEELLLGVYENAIPALICALKRHQADTNPLADAPSLRIAKFALIELHEMLNYGQQAIQTMVTTEHRSRSASWLTLLAECLAAAGNLDGIASQSATPARHYSATPFTYDGTPKRDARFPDPYNMGVNAEAFLYDAQMPADSKVLMMYYKRLREIDVPEMMSSIITETKGKPWGYYR